MRHERVKVDAITRMNVVSLQEHAEIIIKDSERIGRRFKSPEFKKKKLSKQKSEERGLSTIAD